MKFTEFLRGKKTKWILPAAAAAVAAVAVVLFVLNNAAASESAAAAQTVYKETKVQRGDITVGVTESGTASINTNSVTCDLEGAVVEEVYVKAGQSVSQGDAIAKLTAASVNSAVETLQLAMDTAEIKLNQAETAQTTEKVNAKSTYDSSILKKQNAQNTYNQTIATLTNAITTAQAAVDDCTGTITYYQNRLADNAAIIYAEYKIDELKAALDAANAKVNDDITNGYNLTTSPYYAQYNVDLQAQADAQKAYDTAVSNSNSEVAKETSELGNRQSGLASLEEKVTQARLALETGTVTAQDQMKSDVAAGDNASAVYDATLASLQAAVDSAQNDYDTAKEKYDEFSKFEADPVIYSDYTGLVMSSGYAAGDTVTPQTAVATITDNSVVYVTVSVTQDDISDIAVGDSANVEFSSFEGTKFTGTVDSITISPARSESSTVSYVVSVKLTGDGVENVYEGMTSEVTFVTKEVTDVLYVSNKAITAENGVQYAKVKDDQGNVTRVEVTTGFSDGTNTEVVSGLSEGQTIIIESQAVKAE